MYREIIPSERLRPFIECYWVRSADHSDEIKLHRVLPDGCVDFVFNFEAFANSYNGFVVGTMTTPILVESPGLVDFLGVRFRPGKVCSFVNLHASEITDLMIPINDAVGQKGNILTQKLVEIKNVDDRIRVLNVDLEHWLQAENDIQARVDFAVSRIIKSDGSVQIEEICDSLGISRQYLARLFQASIGITPKQFSRVVRFQALLRKIQRSNTIAWADEAAVLGYYDQAHLISDFREFSGMTPQKYLCET